MTVLSTTRNPDKAGALIGIDVDHVLIDDGQIARHVHDILPGGVDTALELVEAPTLPDTLRAARVHGGGLLHRDAVQLVDRARLLPIEYIPRGVRLTSYGGDATDLPAHVLQEYLDSVEAGQAVIPIDHFYTFDQIVEAHTAMEAGPCAREARRDHMTDRGENESPASGPIANCAECHHGFYLLRAYRTVYWAPSSTSSSSVPKCPESAGVQHSSGRSRLHRCCRSICCSPRRGAR